MIVTVLREIEAHAEAALHHKDSRVGVHIFLSASDAFTAVIDEHGPLTDEDAAAVSYGMAD
jgi:hypothetical protein